MNILKFIVASVNLLAARLDLLIVNARLGLNSLERMYWESI